YLLANWHTGNPQLFAIAIIALHQHSDGVAAVFRTKLAGSSSNPALEFVAHHSCPAAGAAFLHRAAVCRVERLEHVLRLNLETVNVIQPSVPGFGDHGK